MALMKQGDRSCFTKNRIRNIELNAKAVQTTIRNGDMSRDDALNI